MQNSSLLSYQTDFIDLLVKSEALLFGQFTLKSGRVAPYFVNVGKFDDAQKISTLGKCYAQHLERCIPDGVDIIFGPAYKGIPLAVTTATALYALNGKNLAYAFDRKEEKTHGDGGKIVGRKISPGARVVLVEDVITAGTTLRLVVPMLRNEFQAKVAGVIVAVDREEKGQDSKSALKASEHELNISIYPIVTIRQILGYLGSANASGFVIPKDILENANKYLEQYGA